VIKATFLIAIDRPAADVYRLLANHENDVKWQAAVAEVRKLSAGPVRAGSRFRHTLQFLGARMEAELEVAQTRPSEFHCFSVVGGPFAFATRVALTASATGTIVQTDVDGHASGAARLALITLSRHRQREIELDLKRLKRMLEAGEL
jgi:uncharacterized membrane protein